ncbi:hypothetical protein E4T39_00163 [Aureobasidium subglaciale]|nr:hypothetical protein E4T39_00163 [Aureobasidium subglaciale]
MKFLQTKEESDPVSKKNKKKQHKKRPRELSEEKISRYFGTEPRNDKTGDEPTLSRVGALAVRPNVTTASPRALHLPEKPYLGFGSRNTRPLTTSYYSWSESGVASSPRARHFGPDLEPLTVGQLQGEQVEKLKETPSMGEAAIEPLLAEQVTIEIHHNGHESKTGQATRPIADSHFRQTTSVEATPICVSNKHSKSTTTTTSHEGKTHRGKGTKPANTLGTNLLEEERPRRFTSQQAEIADDLAVKDHTDPWQELLKDCEVAARPSIPNYRDEVLSRYTLPAFQDYTDLDLWRADDYDFFEHNHPDEPPLVLVDDHICWDRPDAVEYGREGLFFELGEDNVPESLNTNNDYDSALEDEENWCKNGMELQDATLDYQPPDFDAVNELATFWQPHNLY